jgi:hypothetical protein
MMTRRERRRPPGVADMQDEERPESPVDFAVCTLDELPPEARQVLTVELDRSQAVGLVRNFQDYDEFAGAILEGRGLDAGPVNRANLQVRLYSNLSERVPLKGDGAMAYCMALIRPIWGLHPGTVFVLDYPRGVLGIQARMLVAVVQSGFEPLFMGFLGNN